jgi:predicted DNA-binding transcriptional regulator YafY
MADTFIRQWAMLRMIPRAPRKIDTATIQTKLSAQGLEINVRSIQRDLMNLSAIFPITCDERNKPFGWSWLREAEPMDVPGMDPQTALTFHLAKNFLTPLLPRSTLQYLGPYFDRAKSVLDELKRPGIGNWPEKARIVPRGQNLRPPEVDPELLNVIYTALLEEKRFTARYRRRGERKAVEYEVNPLGLVYRHGAAYLIATVGDYEDVMQFALHRFLGAQLTDKRRNAPRGFSLETYLQNGAFDYPKSKDSIELQVLFNSDTAVHLEETPLSPNQHLTKQQGGRTVLQARVQDTAQLRWWLLGFGDQVEVVAPLQLRSEFQQIFANMASVYGAPSKRNVS